MMEIVNGITLTMHPVYDKQAIKCICYIQNQQLTFAGIHINKQIKKIIVASPLGIHARPAALIAKQAAEASGSVYIVKDDEKVDAASIIDILTLGCAKGAEITLQCEEASDEKIFNKIAEIIELGLEE